MRWIVAALALLSSAPSLDPEAVLARMRARQAELSTMRARVEQTKVYPQLGIEDPAERGRFLLERDGERGARVRLEIDSPQPRVLIVVGTRYQLYQPRLRQVIEGELTGAGTRGMFSGLLAGSPEAMDRLERDYLVESAGESEVAGRPVYELTFTARAGAAVYCTGIELAVDRVRFLPLRQTCREANESRVTFTLSDVEIDVPLESGIFELELPKGVERIRN